MGGTLPAAARAVGGDEDAGRRRVAVLYGINTLGAVTGALLATFALLERLGADATLWAAAVLNAVVGGCALWIARAYPAVFDKQVSVAPAVDREVRRSGYVRLLIFATAAVAGMAFLLMELVWYRMLAPLLGGTTYTFGLILAVALLGIGLGGTAYALWGRKQPPALSGLALTCILEALCVAIPFALGDQLAVLAGGLREWGTLGFGGLVLSWSVVVGIVVLPTAVVAGYQFPLLIALLGPGARQLGLDVGWTYAWNTLGAILGALLGGFALLPWLSAPGAWQLVVVLLAVLGGGIAAFAWVSSRQEGESAEWIGLQSGLAVVLAVVAASLLLVTGPTAAWRHTPIGAGLKMLANLSDNEIRGWMQGQRRAVRWEREGIESSVAIRVSDRGPVLFLNGKSEGSAVGDASTQIMSGMIGAILHPQPRNALVIGLGTGSTAGWLAAIDAMERVDVVELEAAVVEAASAFWGGQCERRRPSQGTHGGRRWAGGRPDHPAILRSHILRAFQSLPGGGCEPVHARILRRGRPAAARRRPIRSVGANVRGGRANHPHHLRYPKFGFCARGNLADPARGFAAAIVCRAGVVRCFQIARPGSPRSPTAVRWPLFGAPRISKASSPTT